MKAETAVSSLNNWWFSFRVFEIGGCVAHFELRSMSRIVKIGYLYCEDLLHKSAGAVCLRRRRFLSCLLIARVVIYCSIV